MNKRAVAARAETLLKNNCLILDTKTTGLGKADEVIEIAVVNCIGPNTDIQRHANPLMAQLLKEGLIAPDTHGLGLRVTPDLQVIDTLHNPVQGLWYVGPLLKGTLWEATAVPELRLHAQHLAQTLLHLP